MHKNINAIRNRVAVLLVIVLLLAILPVVMAQSSGTFATVKTVQQGSAPSSPAAGQDVIYTDTSDNLKVKTSSGTVNTVLYTNGSGASLTGLGGDLSGTNLGTAVVASINGKAITLANSFTTSGNFALTLTQTGATNVTLPTSGTLATTTAAVGGDLTGTINNATVASIGGKSVSLAGSFTTSGANSLTLTTTGATNVTLPTSGTLLSTTSLVSGTNISISGTTINTTANIAATQQVSWAAPTSVNWTGTPTLNWNNGNTQFFTLTGNSTVTFSNPGTGGTHYTLVIAQDATGGRSITWPATVKWYNNSAFDFTKMPASGVALMTLELAGDGNYYSYVTPMYSYRQVFTGTLDASGNLAITGTNLQNLQFSTIYTSAPTDANAALYITVASNTSATLHNTGGAVNSGANVQVTAF